MAILRYVKDPAQLKASANPHKGGMKSTVRSVRAFYETDPEIAAALLPRPLRPAARPEIFLQFANVAMHVSPEKTVEINASTVAVMADYEGRRGGYVLGMVMQGDFVVIKGRETFGEPKKIGKVDFDVDGDRFKVAVTRHDIPFIEVSGTIGDSTGPAQFEENFFCHKAMPAIDRREGGFDGDVFLTQLDWKRDYTDVKTCIGDIILRESPWDPMVDVPVRKIVRIEMAEGSTRTSGQVLQKIPPEWAAPFIHQRYDDRLTDGLEVHPAK